VKSPQDQKIIQIDITNACPHRCSNCTRFSGHHRHPFTMDFNTFKRAVDSLQDFPGMVGIMGGEPTLHPQFEQFVEYYRERIGQARSIDHASIPLADFVEYTEEHLAFDTTKRRGLFTSLGPGYYRHFELIQETFPYQCINDHSHPGLHQALLVSRRDIGIADEEWFPLRDSCWIQNMWSSCVTPKGAFFCEVAGALDMLFNGPGGWPVEPGWWKRTPRDFGDQLKWCELCGAALQVPRRRANQEVDDISPALLEKLKNVGSPMVEAGRFELLDPHKYRAESFECRPTNEWYLPDEDNSHRIAGTNSSLHPVRIDAVVIADPVHSASQLVQEAMKQFDKVILAGTRFPKQPPVTDPRLPVVLLDEPDRPAMLRAAVDSLGSTDWVAVLDGDVLLKDGFADRLRSWILNPGCLYEFRRHGSWGGYGDALVQPLAGKAESDLRGDSFCVLMNVRARSLRCPAMHTGSLAPSDGISEERWPSDKRVDMHAFLLQPDPLKERRRLGDELSRHATSVWQILHDCGCTPILYGAGHHTRWLLHLLERHSLPKPVAIVDDNPYCNNVVGVPVFRPGGTDGHRFDTVVVSADPGPMTSVLKARCDEVWGDSVNVVELYRQYPEGRFMKITTPAHTE